MRLMVKGKLFTPKGITRSSILIEEGKIAKIAKDIHESADVVLDYSEKENYLVFPGFIDIHVHMRDFELAYKEDFYTGTGAAAMGGFTIVADMPNTKPKVNTPALLKERDRVAKSKALVDYGLYYGVPEDAAHLTEEVEALAIGLKVFMQHEFYTEKLRLVESVLEYAGKEGMLVVAHAENPKFFVGAQMGTPEAEASAITDMATYASRYGFPLHVTHLSSAAGFEESLKWKKSIKLTTDTCPHYLLLTHDDFKLLGSVAKVFPALKSDIDAKILLERLRGAEIDALSSDHAPHSLREKADPEEAPGGFPGLETVVPLLLTLVNKNLLTFEDLVRVCSTNPSKILRLNEIGAIEEGKMGNLTIVDLHRKEKIDPQLFMSKAKFSPFEGREVEGKAVGTIVRGQPVMLDGEIAATKGWGMNVKNYG